MARHHEENTYDSDYSEQHNGSAYSDKQDKAHRARNARRELERRLEMKALHKILDDYEEYDLD